MSQHSDVIESRRETAQENDVCCDLCGSRERELLATCDDGSYFTCGGCGLVYSIANVCSLPALYDESYQAAGSSRAGRIATGAADSARWPPRWHRKAAERLELFEPYRQTGEFLEIGCSLGDFLNVVNQAGWNAVGIEISDAAAGYARARWKVDVRTGTLESVLPELEAERFDVVWAANLLEHVVSPNEFLASIEKLLRPGGVLIASTLNFDSWAFQFSGGNWQYLYSARKHRFAFSPRLLARYCAKNNLQMDAIETTGFRWISKAQSRRWYTPVVRLCEQGVSGLARMANQGHRVQFVARKPEIAACRAAETPMRRAA